MPLFVYDYFVFEAVLVVRMSILVGCGLMVGNVAHKFYNIRFYEFNMTVDDYLNYVM